jgi:hypothetical protein
VVNATEPRKNQPAASAKPAAKTGDSELGLALSAKQ